MTVDQLPPSAFERRLVDAFVRELSAPPGFRDSEPDPVTLTLGDGDERVLPLYAPTTERRRSSRAVLAAAAALLVIGAVTAALITVNRYGSDDTTPLLSSAPDSDLDWVPLTDSDYSYRHISRIFTSYNLHIDDEQGEWSTEATDPVEAWITLDGSGYETSAEEGVELRDVPADYFRIGGYRPEAIPDTDTLIDDIRDDMDATGPAGGIGTIADLLAFEATDPATRDALLDLLLEAGFERDGDTFSLNLTQPSSQPGLHELTLAPDTNLLQSWTITINGEITHALFVHDLRRAAGPPS